MGVYLSQPNKEKHINSEKGKRMDYVCAQMQGWRKTMEDAAIHIISMSDGNSLFAVFDGHGGHQISKYVSNIFAQELQAIKAYKNKSYAQALEETFKHIDELLSTEGAQRELYKIRYGEYPLSNSQKQFIGGSVGCTANVVLITDTKIFVANAGDSRSVLSRQGKAIPLSFDHKPDSTEQQTRIRKAGGTISMGRVNGGLNLTRSFADFVYKQNSSISWAQQMITSKPDVREFDRTVNDDFILLGCDGIWQKFVDNNQGIIDIVNEDFKKHKPHQKIVEDLLEKLIATETSSGLGCDNMTVVLIVFNN